MDSSTEDTLDYLKPKPAESEPLLGKTTSAPSGFGKRHVLAFWAFLGFFNVYCLRVNLSVALVAMVNSTDDGSSSDNATECLEDAPANTTSSSSTGEFNWDSNTQSLVLGAFFYGYIITQIPGGWLAEVFGGKKLFGLGVLCTAILTLLTPLAARWNLYVFIALRVIEGIGEGVTFPAMNAMWGKWAPLWERSKLLSFTYAGALGCVWFVIWMLIVHDTPAQHPGISKEEREYIETSVGTRLKVKTPWLAIWTCPALYAICVAHFCNNWGFYTMLTCLPTYMKKILHFDVQQDGFLSALPYLVCWMCQTSSGQIADFIRRNKYLSTVSTRKLFNSCGLLFPAILLCCVQFAGCNHAAVVAIVTFAVGLGGLCMGGFNCNHIDIASNFSGTLMGITNMFATIPGFLGPAVVGWLTSHENTRGQWQIVFYISAAIYVTGCLFFNVFAKGEEQSWNNPEVSVLVFKGRTINDREQSDSSRESTLAKVQAY
ncbi:sialin-like isoform X2 [Ostrea edulis]|uniref:sialin-like isoform X2 n=1 Tax=Ostrea edulis TaxID=37623 RepID=UPI0020945523|nr:sialin-like isoform X2 [Ostrea edulis]